MPVQSRLSLADAQRHFRPQTTYLDTATYGLAPVEATEAVLAAERDRAHGRMDAKGFDDAISTSRAAFARLVGVPVGRVAVGSQASQFVGLVAASVFDGATVLVADGDFSSVLFPLAVQHERGVQLRSVPLEGLIDAIEPDVDLVAVSVVQSADGRVTDIAELGRVAVAHGVTTLVDATQAAGWLPLDATRIDYLVASGYKWLLAPKGTCFLTVPADRSYRVRPAAPGMYAGADVWSSIYGLPLRLAGDARRFDLSPAWASWAGQAPAFELVEAVGVEAIHAHDVGLANRFRDGLELPPGDSAIVSIAVDDDGVRRLAAAGVVTAVRAGRIRCAFHLYNTAEDVDRALAALTGR
ncbi:MAG: aminotransferase class V-fold PLP-dependent enzyme [Acidimicrobiales bacterium]